MRRVVGAGIAAFFGMSLPAYAADLDDGSFKDAPVAYDTAHSWAGLYVGGSAGFAEGDLIEARTRNAFYPRSLAGPERTESRSWEMSNDISEAIYGAHIGYNLQFGRLVAGLEAGINRMNIEDCTGSCNSLIQTKVELDWYATAVARLGYAEGSWLLYGFGGVAWASANIEAKDNLPRSVFPPISPSNVDIDGGKSDHVGWTAGVRSRICIQRSFISARRIFARRSWG